MSAREIGKQLVALCREGKNLESVRTLYAEDIESIEAAEPPGGESQGFARVTRGKQAVLDKNVKWDEQNEIHETRVTGPYPHGHDKFAVRFEYDITNRQLGMRMKVDEIGVFTLLDGKVAREEFFYDMGG